MRVLAIDYRWRDFSPAYTVGSRVLHFARVAAQLANTVHVFWLNAAETPQLPADGETEADKWAADVAKAQAVMLRVHATGSTLADKLAFLDFYHERSTYKKKE